MLVTERDAVKRTKQRSHVTSPKDHWSDGSLVRRVNSAKVVRWWRERISCHWCTSKALVLSKMVDWCGTGLPFLRSYQRLGGHGTVSHKYCGYTVTVVRIVLRSPGILAIIDGPEHDELSQVYSHLSSCHVGSHVPAYP